jgi:hypothetical protein
MDKLKPTNNYYLFFVYWCDSTLEVHYCTENLAVFPHCEESPRTPTLQRHCKENLKQIFPEIKLRGLVSNFHIHISVSDLYMYIHTIGHLILRQKIGGPIVGIYKSLTDK